MRWLCLPATAAAQGALPTFTPHQNLTALPFNPHVCSPARPAAQRPRAATASVWALQLLVAALLCCTLLKPANAAAQADALSEARALSAQGDLPAALRRVDQAMAADPRDVQLRFLRGVLLMDLQRDGEALAHFQQMSLEFPELPDPFNNLALLHARAQRLDDARVALETALRNDPTHRTARANLGQLYLMLAARAWETLAAQGPMEPQQQRVLQAVRTLLLQEFKLRSPG